MTHYMRIDIYNQTQTNIRETFISFTIRKGEDYRYEN